MPSVKYTGDAALQRLVRNVVQAEVDFAGSNSKPYVARACTCMHERHLFCLLAHCMICVAVKKVATVFDGKLENYFVSLVGKKVPAARVVRQPNPRNEHLRQREKDLLATLERCVFHCMHMYQCCFRAYEDTHAGILGAGGLCECRSLSAEQDAWSDALKRHTAAADTLPEVKNDDNSGVPGEKMAKELPQLARNALEEYDVGVRRHVCFLGGRCVCEGATVQWSVPFFLLPHTMCWCVSPAHGGGCKCPRCGSHPERRTASNRAAVCGLLQ